MFFCTKLIKSYQMAETNDIQERAFAKATGQEIYGRGDEIVPRETNGEIISDPPPAAQTQQVASTEADVEKPEELEVYTKFFEKRIGKKEDEVKSLLSRKSLDEEVQERVGRPLAELEELVKNPPKSVEFERDLLKNHQDYLRAGGTEAEWRKSLVAQERLSEMGHDELVKHGLKLKHPGLAPEKINLMFKSQYKIPAPFDPDRYTEQEVADRNEEIEVANLRLEVEAEEIRKAEMAKAVKAMESPISREKPLAPEVLAKQEAERKEAAALMNEARSKLTARKGLEIEITEGEKGKETVSKVTYDLSPEEKKVAENILKSPDSFFWSMFTEDGKLDPGKWEKTAALIAGGERAIERMATDYAHAKLEAYIKGLNNATFKPGEMRLAPTTDQKQHNKELSDKMLGKA